MAARQAVERIIDLRYTLRSFGVPIDGPAWLFGDNKSVVTSSTIPHSSLGKRWNALSYHRVREAIAGGWMRFEHIPGTQNPADILTKSLAWAVSRYYVEPMLFWKGETLDAPSGSLNTEGSVTGPRPKLTDGVVADKKAKKQVRFSCDEEDAQVDARGQDLVETTSTPVFPELWNNQYAVLYYEDEMETD